VQQAEIDDPRNDAYAPLLDYIQQTQTLTQRDDELRAALAKSPYDVNLNLDLAKLLQAEGRYDELNDRLRMAAGLTNWTHDAMADVIQYYVSQVNNPNAAIAFLEARAKIDPSSGELVYSLAALDATVGRKDDAVKNLARAFAIGGTNAMTSAQIDPRFAGLHDDPDFLALLTNAASASPPPAPATNAPSPAMDLPGTAANAPSAHAPAETNAAAHHHPKHVHK
jgi:tetratricopeptide (TPR) repeat protein